MSMATGKSPRNWWVSRLRLRFLVKPSGSKDKVDNGEVEIPGRHDMGRTSSEGLLGNTQSLDCFFFKHSLYVFHVNIKQPSLTAIIIGKQSRNRSGSDPDNVLSFVVWVHIDLVCWRWESSRRVGHVGYTIKCKNSHKCKASHICENIWSHM